MKFRLPAVLLTAAVLVAPAFAQTPAPAKPVNAAAKARIADIIHSLQQVKSIRSVQISPDGSLIAWDVRDEGIYLAPMSNPSQAQHIIACSTGEQGKEKGLAFSPDSSTLAFFSNCTPSGKVAIFTVATASPTATPHLLAQLDGSAQLLKYSPDGKSLSFLYVKGAIRPPGALAPMTPPSGVIGVTHIQHQRIATVNAATGQLTQVTPYDLYVYEYGWSPDSTQIAYTAAPPPGIDNWWTAELYTQQAAAGATPKVVFDPNTSTGSLHGLQIALPRFSPDGSQIAFIGGLMSDQGVTGGDIYVIPATGAKAADDVTAGSDETASWFKWVDEDNLGIAGIKGADSHLYLYNLDSNTASPAYNLTIPGHVGAGSLFMRISTSADNSTIAFIQSSFDHVPEVWAGPLNDLQQITHLNAGLKPAWGKSKAVYWTNEGFHLDGWLLYPANYDPAKKYPLIVYVHGGPSYANLSRWPDPGYGPAPFSAMGYFVLMPNPRGSFGEGEAFTQANRKDFGYGDLRDILAGVNSVIAHNPSIDPDRVGITGWSYGGFMTMFAITQTHRFKAAVSGAGISDWLSYYGENSIDEWMVPFFGASVYTDPAVYAKSSAMNYIKNVKTPTLMVVGADDGECPAPQSFELWRGLRYFHVPTELVVYPDEGHGFHKAADRINVLERALGWFNQYMP